MRQAIVDQVLAESGKRDRGYANARGNIVAVLTAAGFSGDAVIRAALAATGLKRAKASWLAAPPPWPPQFDIERCREVRAFPIAIIKGGWRLAYDDPERAVSAVRTGLPPHKPRLVLPHELDALFAIIADDPFTARATTVVPSRGGMTEEKTFVGAIPGGGGHTEEQAEFSAPSAPLESMVAWADDDELDDAVENDGTPVMPLFAEALADSLSGDEPEDLAAKYDVIGDEIVDTSLPRARRTPPPSDNDDDNDFYVDRPPSLAPAKAATSTSHSTASTSKAARPPAPPPPPSPPVRLKQKKAPPPAPAPLRAIDIALPSTSTMRQRLLAAAAVFSVVGGIAVAVIMWRSQAGVVAVASPQIKGGKLDVTLTQRSLIEQAAAAPPDKRVMLLTHAYDLDPKTNESHEALLARTRLLIELKRGGAAARDIEKLRAHPKQLPLDQMTALENEVTSLTLSIPQPVPPLLPPEPPQEIAPDPLDSLPTPPSQPPPSQPPTSTP